MTITEQLAAALREAEPWPAKVRLGDHLFQNSYDDGSYYCYELRASIKFADRTALAAFDTQPAADDGAVERVARAIRQQYEAEYEEDPGDWWCEQLARAALAAMAAPAADDWQDIATAPKTDPVNMRALPFLGWCPDKTAPLGGDVRVIWWEPVMQRADETSPRARWFGDRDMEEHPTHWRPLPPAPATEAKGSGQ